MGYYYYLANTYGSGTYNDSTYNGAAVQNTNSNTPAATPATGVQTAAPAAPNGGLLANTGFDVLLAVTLACLIIFAALIVRFWRRPAKTNVSNSAASDF